jgi:glycosyltransferase involved in cell wall biosynthesis
VPVEDPIALAAGIEHVLDCRSTYDPRRLHQHAVERFGTAAVGGRIEAIYDEVLDGFASAG